MATPFTPNAFTPPSANDPASIVRAILQLQQALGGTGTIPLNNLNVLQNKTPPNNALSTIPRFTPGGGSGTGPTGPSGTGPTGPRGPQGDLTSVLPYAGITGATFHFDITSTLGWPLCGFGLGANLPSNAWLYTPQSSGQLLVTFQASIIAPTSQNLMVRGMFGAGTPPGFGGTGGSPITFAQGLIGAQAGVFQPVTLQGIISGLSVGVRYWFDLALLSNSAGTARVGQLTPNAPPIWTVVEL